MSKITILGERPGPNTDPLRPLYPHTTTGAAANLARLMGLSIEDYLRVTERYNAVDDLKSSTSSSEARERVAQIVFRLRASQKHELLIVCGRSAANALPSEWRKKLDYLNPVLDYSGNMRWLLIPHPSGRNRMFNDPAYTERTKVVLEQCVAVWRAANGLCPAMPAEYIPEPLESLGE